MGQKESWPGARYGATEPLAQRWPKTSGRTCLSRGKRMPRSVPEVGKGTPARAAGERPLPVVILIKMNPECGVMSWDMVLVHQTQA